MGVSSQVLWFTDMEGHAKIIINPLDLEVVILYVKFPRMLIAAKNVISTEPAFTCNQSNATTFYPKHLFCSNNC